MPPEFAKPQASHGAVFGLAVVDELRSRGFSTQQIAGNSGINLRALYAEEPRLSFEALALLFERAAELTNDDLLGFRHGQTREIRLAGMAAYVGISSSNVRECLQNVFRYTRIFSDVLEVDLSHLEDQGVLQWQYRVPASVRRQQYVEFAITGVISDLRSLTGRGLNPKKIEFRHHRSRRVQEMAKFFGCDVEFGASHNRIVLKPSDLDAPLMTSDNHLHIMMKRLCEAGIAQKGEHKKELLVSLEREIADRLASGGATQENVAKALGMSSRTLARKLATSGTTFFQVVDAYRKVTAERLISDTGLQLTQVAFLLGYSDLSSFSTAFRRWTGRPPSDLRKSSSG